MTYQGARAQPRETETGRFFAVSKVRLDRFLKRLFGGK